MLHFEGWQLGLLGLRGIWYTWLRRHAVARAKFVNNGPRASLRECGFFSQSEVSQSRKLYRLRYYRGDKRSQVLGLWAVWAGVRRHSQPRPLGPRHGGWIARCKSRNRAHSKVYPCGKPIPLRRSRQRQTEVLGNEHYRTAWVRGHHEAGNFGEHLWR